MKTITIQFNKKSYEVSTKDKDWETQKESMVNKVIEQLKKWANIK